jgi:hypothetical protein
MDTTTHYKGFVIEAIKGETLWKIRFRKIDGSPIRTAEGQFPSIESPELYPTTDAGLQRVKELIDAPGGMS